MPVGELKRYKIINSTYRRLETLASCPIAYIDERKLRDGPSSPKKLHTVRGSKFLTLAPFTWQPEDGIAPPPMFLDNQSRRSTNKSTPLLKSYRFEFGCNATQAVVVHSRTLGTKADRSALDLPNLTKRVISALNAGDVSWSQHFPRGKMHVLFEMGGECAAADGRRHGEDESSILFSYYIRFKIPQFCII